VTEAVHRIRRAAAQRPALARVAPFAVFIAITAGQDLLGGVWPYVLYALKTALAAWMIWVLYPVITEMRWALSLGAVAAGVAIFAMWVGLDDLLVRIGFPSSYPRLTTSDASWNPVAHFGRETVSAWFFVAVRLAGATLVVPALEEVFFRSLVYRSLAAKDFLQVELGHFAWMPFLVTSLLFGSEHHEWLAGVLCGFALQGLVCWKNRLGDAMTAHAITNFLLGVWVVWRGAWHFW